jgi:hypothetical protein
MAHVAERHAGRRVAWVSFNQFVSRDQKGQAPAGLTGVPDGDDLLSFCNRLAFGHGAFGLRCDTCRDSLSFLRSAVWSHDVSVPGTIGGRQGAADCFIPPPSIASIAKSIAAFAA